MNSDQKYLMAQFQTLVRELADAAIRLAKARRDKNPGMIVATLDEIRDYSNALLQLEEANAKLASEE